MRTRILMCLILALPVLGLAETIEISILTEDVQTVLIEGEEFTGFQLTLPEQVTADNFLIGQLGLNVGRKAECSEEYFEVQIAHLENGVPVVPTRKTRFVSEIGTSVETENLYLDLSAIIRHCLAAEEGAPILVLGALSEDVAECAVLSALDAETGVWAQISLLTRD